MTHAVKTLRSSFAFNYYVRRITQVSARRRSCSGYAYSMKGTLSTEIRTSRFCISSVYCVGPMDSFCAGFVDVCSRANTAYVGRR